MKHSFLAKFALWIGTGLILAMLLFPPWKFTFHNVDVHVQKSGPYALIFAPPPVPVGSPYDSFVREYWHVGIDYGRLAPPVAAVAIVMLVLVFTLKTSLAAVRQP